MSQENILSMSAVETAKVVKSGEVTAEAVVEAHLAQIQKLNPTINCFVTTSAQAKEQAKELDRRIAKGESPGGRLAGVPIAMKDLLCTKGLTTTASSKILAGFVPPYSATVVSRLESEGAIIIGKTSLDEFGMGSSNENAASGPVRNPWNTDYVPGGSSGGSAAAVASYMAPVGIGTDTGGSIRQPAHFCNLYGIKPTYGRVSRYGIIAFASSLDQAGPMARSTEDCATVLEVISGHCRKDSTSSTEVVPSFTAQLNGDIKGLRIGLPKQYFSETIDSDTERLTKEAIQALKEAGAIFVDIDLKLVQHAVPVYYLVATSEASSNLARYDGIRYGHRTGSSIRDLDDLYSRSRSEGFGPEVKRRIMLGTYALSSGYYEAYYQKASQVRRLIHDEFQAAFKTCDAILSPVSTSPAFKIGERIGDQLTMYLNDIFTTSTNLAGLPGMSVPVGFSQKGLPIGVQIMGRHFDEMTVLNVSQALENAFAQVTRRRPDGIIR